MFHAFLLCVSIAVGFTGLTGSRCPTIHCEMSDAGAERVPSHAQLLLLTLVCRLVADQRP